MSPTAALILLGEKISLPRASTSTTCVCGAATISKDVVEALVATVLLGNVIATVR
jgi:hypothetical protein